MIDPTRKVLLELIEELSAECPDYRFGQLVLNLAFLAREDGDSHAWELDDLEFVEAARKHLADWQSRHGIEDLDDSGSKLGRSDLIGSGNPP